MESSTFHGKFILIAGSASRSCTAAKLRLAHAVVRELTGKILEAGGGLVVFAGGEPTTDDDSGVALIFDWAVLRHVETYVAQSLDPPRPCVVVVTSQKAWSRKMTDAHRQLLGLLSGNAAAEIVYVDDDVHTGGNIGDEQVQRADAMIALGGGKGVADRAQKVMRKGSPVLPLDLALGALSDDGDGAVGLHRKLLSEPDRFFPNTHASVQSQIPSLSLELTGSDPAVVATRIVQVIASEWAAARASAPIDVVVLTALPIELAAVKSSLGLSGRSPSIRMTSGTVYWVVEIKGRGGMSSYGLAVTCVGGAGNVEAAAAATEVITELKPKLVIMVGIAAGMRGKCKLGEVVLSERVVAYEPAAAAVVDGLSRELPRPESFTLAHAIQQDVVGYLADAMLPTRLSQHSGGTGPSIFADVPPDLVAHVLTVRPATIGSGEKLVRDPEKFRALREIHGKIEVGEMEAAGVAAACHRLGAWFLVVRGISDFGDDTKDDRFHSLAAMRAAIVAVDFIQWGFRA